MNRIHDPVSELRRVYLFADMADTHLKTLIDGMQDIHLAAGEGLFLHGQPAERFFFLREDLIKLFRISPEGDEKIIEIMHPGETFAEAVMFMGTQGRYPVNAEAVSEARLYAFGQKTFLALLQDSNEARFGLLASMSRRLHMLVNQIESLTLQNATYRLVAYLLEQLPQDRAATSAERRDRLAPGDPAGDAVAYPRQTAPGRVDRGTGQSDSGARRAGAAQPGAPASG